MSISQAILAGLEARAPFSGGVETFASAQDGKSVRCAVVAADGCGCALQKIESKVQRPSKWPTKDLEQYAHALTKRIRYLMEPLRLVELDRAAGQALVLSTTPKRKGNTVSFYELCARDDGTTSLVRKSTGERSRQRVTVPFRLTPEQLEQLIDDLIETSRAFG